MEKENVPQDDNNVLQGKLRVLKYAVDEEGNYTKVPSVGWEPENIVLSQAWEEINNKTEAVKSRVIKGEISPIAYYMEKQMMDIKMLSDYVGYWSFRVKSHLKPEKFIRLSAEQLAKYAHAFQITVQELIHPFN